ncbi:hypothetical protein [Massilibacteroides sp.]|uniref:hypothetical protein n=1 Tax=Massilibacteroides sp. TaxID=2034766 RepID=UPI002626B836|nr:hypothetical protein [Massilibacteroides sp.]MDD4515986.1 hypothetical protein [Massilibacteroides sp.]
MNYVLLFCVLLFSSCGVPKKTESKAARLRTLTDTSIFRQMANRHVKDLYFIREVRMSPPDSSGKQHISGITETRRIFRETDSLSLLQDHISLNKETEVISIKQEPVAVHSFPFRLSFLILAVGLIYLFRRKFARST